MSTVLLKLTSDASVRGMVAPDGTHRFSVYDFITMACQKSDDGEYARKTYSNLVKEGSEFKNEVEKNVHDFKFPGAGQRETPTMTLRGLQRLLLILGTKIASEFRVLLEGTFTRVMAGDTSLIEVIRSNAASDAPVHQAYRQALAQEPVEEDRKRKAEDLDLRERLSKVKDAEIARINAFASTMDMLNPDWKEDTRFRLRVEDLLKNTLLDEERPVIKDGVSLTQSVSVGEVAQKMGVQIKKHGDSVAIGKAVAEAYFKKYGKPPPKHRQWVDGAEREINSYTEEDRCLIEKAIRMRMLGAVD